MELQLYTFNNFFWVNTRQPQVNRVCAISPTYLRSRPAQVSFQLDGETAGLLIHPIHIFLSGYGPSDEPLNVNV